jgi:hypothetical protein
MASIFSASHAAIVGAISAYAANYPANPKAIRELELPLNNRYR